MGAGGGGERGGGARHDWFASLGVGGSLQDLRTEGSWLQRGKGDGRGGFGHQAQVRHGL